MRNLLESTNGIFKKSLLNLFSGGGLAQLSIVMLGVGPYITSSIIMQLLTIMFPKLKEMYQEEGEAGRQKFNQYSRLLTVPLSYIQGYALMALLIRQSILPQLSLVETFGTLTIVTCGSLFLMWLGELISEKKLGNGVSLLILAGIMAGLPQTIQQAAFSYTPDQLFTYIA